MMTASAPGKLIIAGEYAVLQGGPAVVVAVNRRVVATIGERTMASPFLAAVTAALAEEFGDDDEITQRSLAIHIDSSALYLDGAKLGLGSSAAVTVAAVALAIGNTTNNLPRIYRIAAHAHAEAQGARGARGSGADIAAAVFGGALQFQRSGAHSQLPWPGHNDDVAWIPCFLGAPADTATLVQRVAAATDTVAVDAALATIAAAAAGVIAALHGGKVVPAIGTAADALDQLGRAAQIDLTTDAGRRLRAAAQSFGGEAKPTGAGGGDVAIVVVPKSAEPAAHLAIHSTGCLPLDLHAGAAGVMVSNEL